MDVLNDNISLFVSVGVSTSCHFRVLFLLIEMIVAVIVLIEVDIHFV
jgi:hypothetical protein